MKWKPLLCQCTCQHKLGYAAVTNNPCLPVTPTEAQAMWSGYRGPGWRQFRLHTCFFNDLSLWGEERCGWHCLFSPLFYFFHHRLSPPLPPPPPSATSHNYYPVVVHVWALSLFFSTLLNPSTFPPQNSLHQSCLPAVHLWVSIFAW